MKYLSLEGYFVLIQGVGLVDVPVNSDLMCKSSNWEIGNYTCHPVSTFVTHVIIYKTPVNQKENCQLCHYFVFFFMSMHMSANYAGFDVAYLMEPIKNEDHLTKY